MLQVKNFLSSHDQWNYFCLVILEANPLCAYALTEVVYLFRRHFPLSHLHVEDKLSLELAFELLMERKDELLTSFEWTRLVFAYMKNLDGLSVKLKQHIANQAFIPIHSLY